MIRKQLRYINDNWDKPFLKIVHIIYSKNKHVLKKLILSLQSEESNTCIFEEQPSSFAELCTEIVYLQTTAFIVYWCLRPNDITRLLILQ